jgi:hypothetical protein
MRYFATTPSIDITIGRQTRFYHAFVTTAPPAPDSPSTVTFPARQYSVNGERRSFAPLRPIVDASAQEGVRDLLLDAYAAHEEQAELRAS